MVFIFTFTEVNFSLNILTRFVHSIHPKESGGTENPFALIQSERQRERKVFPFQSSQPYKSH